uniref:GAR domain-containing protein n=1 Tax=Panagrellus redivivus TaxID=6233 RepID=A0A7E4ZUS0_PANRE
METFQYKTPHHEQLTASKQRAEAFQDEIAQKAEILRDISQLAVKIENEVRVLDELRRDDPNVKVSGLHVDKIQYTVTIPQKNYEEIVQKALALIAFLNKFRSLLIVYKDSVNEARGWIADVDNSLDQSGSSAGSPEQQLQRLLELQQVIAHNRPKIDAVKDTCDDAMNCIAGTDAHDKMSSEERQVVGDLVAAFQGVSDRLKSNIDNARAEIAQKEGVKLGLDKLQRWLSDAELDLKKSEALPLVADKLNQLKYNDQLRENELTSQEKVLADLGVQLERMRAVAPGTVAAEKLDEAFGQVERKFSRVKSIRKGLSDNILDAISTLGDLNATNDGVNRTLRDISDDLDRADPSDDTAMKAIEDALGRVIDEDWVNMQKLAKRLLSMPNVSDTKPLNDVMSGAEAGINRAQKRLTDRLAARNKLDAGKAAFGQKIADVDEKLTAIENDLRALILDVSIDLDVLEAQKQDTADVGSRLKQSRANFEELDRLANELIGYLGLNASKRRSIDFDSPATAAGAGAILTVTNQLADLRARHNDADRALDELNSRLNANTRSRNNWENQRDALSKWIAAEEAQLRQRQADISLDEPGLKSTATETTASTGRWRERQPKLSELQQVSAHLVQVASADSRPEEVEAVQKAQVALNKAFVGLDKNNADLSTCTDIALRFLSEAKVLEKWINSEQRVLNVCSTSADPVQTASNLEGVKANIDEEAPNLKALNNRAEELLELCTLPEFNKQVKDKIDDVNKRWNALVAALNNCTNTMAEARVLNAEVGTLQSSLKDSTAQVEALLSEAAKAPVNSPEQAELLAKAQGILDNDIASIVDKLNAVTEKFDALTSDPITRSEVGNKLNAARTDADQLSNKLDGLRKAAQGAQSAEQELSAQISDARGKTKALQDSVSRLKPLSADPSSLGDQAKDFDPIAADVLDREGAMMLLKNSLAEAVAKAPSPGQKAKLQAELDTIAREWDPLVESVKQRKRQLEKAATMAEEWADLEVDLKNKLASIKDEIEAAKAADKNGEEMPDLRPVEEAIAALRPRADGLLALSKDLAGVAPGPEANKLVREAEAYIEDAAALAKECAKQAELATLRNNLRDGFERGITASKNLLDRTRTEAGLTDGDDETDGAGRQLSSDALKALGTAFTTTWDHQRLDLVAVADRLKPLIDGDEFDQISDVLQDLDANAKDIRAGLDAAVNKLADAEGLVAQTSANGRAVIERVGGFAETVLGLSPIGRDFDTLEQQAGEDAELAEEADRLKKELAQLALTWQDHVDAGRVTRAASEAPLAEIAAANAKLDAQQARLAARGRDREAVAGQLSGADAESESIVDAIAKLADAPIFTEPIAAELLEIRQQQTALKHWRAHELKPTLDAAEEQVAAIQDLIKSAGHGVDTTALEDMLGRITDAVNGLNDKVAERERRIEAAIQGLGSYNDAYRALLNWIEEVEEIMNNEKPPSNDCKVTAVQLHNHACQVKLIEDKQSGVDGFLKMIDHVESLTTDPDSKASMRAKAEDISSRYNALVDGVKQRRQLLLDALKFGEEWAAVYKPMVTFLKECDENIQALTSVPTNPEKLESQLEKQRILMATIDEHAPHLETLTSIYNDLVAVVGPEDAAELGINMRSVDDRYRDARDRCASVGQTLTHMRSSIRDFVEDVENLTTWLDEAEANMTDMKEISIYPEELVEQSDKLVKLIDDITDQQETVAQVVADANELRNHTNGADAMALQYRIENLRQRYTALSATADEQIEAMTQALPLAEELHGAFGDISDMVEGYEADLDNLDQLPLEEQSQIVTNMEASMVDAKIDMDGINEKSLQLQHLSSRRKADELAKRTAELNRAFNAANDRVLRKADALAAAERQSKQVFDDLDFYIDWFTQANDRITSADTPCIDTERLQQQLRNQHLMNQDMQENKIKLRETIVAATKVVRDLRSTLGGEEVTLQTKMDSARKLADDTVKLGDAHYTDLEQAFALCHELDESYTELSEWLDAKAAEIAAFEPINAGMSAEQLLAHKAANQAALQAYRDLYPIVTKFERNVATLAELVTPADADNLAEISTSTVERFRDQEAELRARGLAIDANLEHTSAFADRLDSWLSDYESTHHKVVRHPDPVSARPPVLKRQISDHADLLAVFLQKQVQFEALKADANTVIAQSSPGDPAVAEVAHKMNLLENLAAEISESADRRSAFLQDTLDKAERFWAELDNCQRVVDNLMGNLNSIEVNTTDPQALEDNKAVLGSVEAGIAQATPAVNSLRAASSALAANVADEEKYQVEQQVAAFEANWGTVTGIYAQMSTNLIDAMNRSMNFHELLQQQLAWLAGAEARLAGLSSSATELPAIRAELDRIDEFRRDIDTQAVYREQLLRAADELIAHAGPAQAAALRIPMNDLNGRWHKLYTGLNDRQQRLERALLEGGQFDQAAKSLATWISKTDATLDELQPMSRDQKHIEVELCKLKVIQNDILAHLPSFEAIIEAGKTLIASDPSSAAITQPKMNALTENWHMLTDKSEQLWTKLEIAKGEASDQGGELDHWALWLEDLLNELSVSKLVGGLPETAQSQLDDFRVIAADVEAKRPEMDAILERVGADVAAAGPETAYLRERHTEMRKNWVRVNEKLVDREKRLKIALDEANALNDDMQNMTRWLDNAENYLSSLPLVARLPEALDAQIAEHEDFFAKVSAQREAMSDLSTRGSKIQLTCERKDAIPIKNRLISLKHRFDKVANRTADRRKTNESARGESQNFFNAFNDLMSFLDGADATLSDAGDIASDSATADHLRDSLDEHKKVIDDLAARKQLYEVTEKRGRGLRDHAPNAERPKIEETMNLLTNRWKATNAAAHKRQRSLEDAIVQSGKFDEALADVLSWLGSTLPPLEAELAGGKLEGDVNTLQKLYEDHHALVDEVKGRSAGVNTLKARAGKILESPDSTDAEKAAVQAQLDRLNDEWARLDAACDAKNKALNDAISTAVDLDNAVADVNQTLNVAESKLRHLGSMLPEDEDEAKKLLAEMEAFGTDLVTNQKPEIDKAVELGNSVLDKVHPKAEEAVRKLVRGLTGRWTTLEADVAEKQARLKQHIEDLKAHDNQLADITDFIEAKETALNFKDAEGDATSLPQVDDLLNEHDLFKADIAAKQPEVDEVLKTAKKLTQLAPQQPDSPTTPDPMTTSVRSGKSLLRSVSKPSKPEKKRQSKRQSATEAVAERWRKLNEHTVAYDKHLRDRKDYLAEMKRLEKFTFDEWRQRYLAWNDHGKARISDLFRRIDKSGTGVVPREDFIQGVLLSKFPTTKLEMARVADKFDKGDGKISAKEFMNALRYDPKKQPVQKTDAEMIHEELRKEQGRCTCANRFPITHISTTESNVQYGFGFGNTMKRMVRILRSTVMVRVGGGWDKLDEFLVKHDPCRAAGRLNVQLHKTPDNAVDQMHVFKTRRPSDMQREVMNYADGSTSTPILKIREKTDRSVPMFKRPGQTTPRTPASRESPYSSRRASDVNYADSKIPRPSPLGSRAGSRSNVAIAGLSTPVTSRPPSRMSDSDERPPSRIPSIRGAKGVGRLASGASSARASPHPR